MRQLYLRAQEWYHRGPTATVGEPAMPLINIDALVYIVSILSILFTLDQVRIIWADHNAAGVSLVSWIFYTVSAGVWFFYGYIRKDKVILVTNFLWVVFSLLIVIGVLMHG